MELKKNAALAVVLLMILSISTFAETKINQLNRFPLMDLPKEIESVNDLQLKVKEYADRIKQGFAEAQKDSPYTFYMRQAKDGKTFEEADKVSLYGLFKDQVESGKKIEERIIKKDQLFEWMLYYKNQTKVLRDVVWDGKEYLKAYVVTAYAYVITVSGENICKKFEFWIPTICGNVSLAKPTDVNANCMIKATPKKVEAGKLITVDMSGSDYADAYEITVLHEGKQVRSQKLEGGKNIWETSFDKPGNYEFDAKAINNCGLASTNECKDSIQVTKDNIPPECALKVSPKDGYCGDKFTFDASGSHDDDGEVVEANFTLTNNDSRKSESLEPPVRKRPFILEKVIKKSGHYTASAKVKDNLGAESKNTCEVSDIKVQKRLYFLVEAGPMVAKGTYTGYIFARVGLAYLIVPEKLSFIASGGYAINLGCDFFKSHFLSNFLLNVHFKKFFVGGGFGFSSKVRDAVFEDGKPRVEWKSNIDIVGNVGYDLFAPFNKKGSIFGEIRIPIKKGLEFKRNHAFLLGFRLLF